VLYFIRMSVSSGSHYFDPGVQLSDDKKQSRATRFGIPIKEVKQSVVSTSNEEQKAFNDKKRKRAERYDLDLSDRFPPTTA
jgi:hypothetical protein